jgi:hypothetical protein
VRNVEDNTETMIKVKFKVKEEYDINENIIKENVESFNDMINKPLKGFKLDLYKTNEIESFIYEILNNKSKEYIWHFYKKDIESSWLIDSIKDNEFGNFRKFVRKVKIN